MWKRSVIIPVAILAVAVGLFVAIRTGWPSRDSNTRAQQTDDAYIRADQTPLSTRISGTVRSVKVGDYQTVKAGQLLVELEDSDYQAAVAEAKAALEAAKAEYAANQNAKRVADATISAATEGILAAQATAASAKSAIDSATADTTHTQSDFHRQQALLANKAATQQQLEDAQASRDRATAALDARQAEFARATAGIASSRSSLVEATQQRAALNAKDGVLKAQIDAKTAAITVAEVNLGYTKIYAPANGAVGEFRVHPGQLVGAGIQVVEVIQSGIWVQANFRETQLLNVGPGSPADVDIDALPHIRFHGHVSEISPASGSQFALLPPDNATGNYTKIVQRVPVRIILDSNQPLQKLRPGFSAVVTIHPSGVSPDGIAETASNRR